MREEKAQKPGQTFDWDSLPGTLKTNYSVMLRTLVAIRWLAVVGQGLAIFMVFLLLGFDLPILLALGTVGTSIIFNIYLTLTEPRSKQLSDDEASGQLLFDLLQLSALLYLTGGLENPFFLFLLAPVTISASVLSSRSTGWLVSIAILVSIFLALFHLPLPWRGSELQIPPIYLLGLWTSIVISMIFLAVYVGKVSREARYRSEAFFAMREALAKEHKIAALGALSAAAAHELGSPLGTITIAAKELEQELGKDTPLGREVGVIVEQALRCREILASLSETHGEEKTGFLDRLPLQTVVEEAAAPYGNSGALIEIDPSEMAAGEVQPLIYARPEIIHGLGNFIENAVGFARTVVRIRLGWDDEMIEVEVSDDGRGFGRSLLDRLGEPYLTDRRASDVPEDPAGGLGLGVYIAKTLLEHSGARISFANGPLGGATVLVRWPREMLEKVTVLNKEQA